MKKILSVVLCFIVISCATKKQQEVKSQETPKLQVSHDFVQGSEDIPLLKGLEKVFDEGLGFDSANGSLMSSSYETKIDITAIKDFYVRTLPQMGWKELKNKNLKQASSDKIKFKRDNEQLEIEFSKKDNSNFVKFFISSVL